MLSLTLKVLSKRARAVMPIMVCIGLFCYFSANFAGGDHGLEARDQLKLRVVELRHELQEMKKQRQHYQHRLTLLEKSPPSQDLKDEIARKQLQYAHPDDLVLFD